MTRVLSSVRPALVICSVLLLASPAHAARVEVTDAGLQFVDSDGERNVVTLSGNSSPDGWLIAVRAGQVELGPGCEEEGGIPLGPVLCRYPTDGSAGDAHFDLGGGDDDLTLSGAMSAHVDGGSGNDKLVTGEASYGRLSGGGGTDELRMYPMLYKSFFIFDVTLDGQPGDNGRPGVNVLPDWEIVDLRGSVTGSAQPEMLSGTGTIDGAGGNDMLTVAGNSLVGTPRVIGGPGRDVMTLAAPELGGARGPEVLARDGEVDTINCRSAVPGAFDADANDVAEGCAPAASYAGPAGPPLRVDKRGHVTATIKCEAPSDIPCTGRAVLRTRPSVFGQPETTPVVFYARGSTGSITPGTTKNVKLKVAARWRRAITRGERVIASLVVETRRATPVSSRTSILGDVVLRRR